MEVTISTSHGKLPFSLQPSWTVEKLQEELHSKLTDLKIPAPDEQRLICPNNRLKEVSKHPSDLVNLFIKPGDELIVLPRRQIPSKDDATYFPPRPTTPAVTAAEVNTAIREDNERREAAGEAPFVPQPEVQRPRPRLNVADRLEGSIRALAEGNYDELRGYLEQLQNAMVRANDGEVVIEGLGDEDEDEGEGAPHEAGPVQIPEVEQAHLTELMAMGFSEQLSRNALLMHRNRLQLAVEWALTHVDDPEAQQPLSEEVLAAVYNQGRMGMAGRAARPLPRVPRGQINAAHLEILAEMGFDNEQAQRALLATNNSVSNATQLLLSGMPLPPLPEGVIIAHATAAAAAGENGAGQGGEQGQQPAAAAAAEGGEGGEGQQQPAAENQAAAAEQGEGEEHEDDEDHDDSMDEEEDFDDDDVDDDAPMGMQQLEMLLGGAVAGGGRFNIQIDPENGFFHHLGAMGDEEAFYDDEGYSEEEEMEDDGSGSDGEDGQGEEPQQPPPPPSS